MFRFCVTMFYFFKNRNCIVKLNLILLASLSVVGSKSFCGDLKTVLKSSIFLQTTRYTSNSCKIFHSFSSPPLPQISIHFVKMWYFVIEQREKFMWLFFLFLNIKIKGIKLKYICLCAYVPHLPKLKFTLMPLLL